MKKFYYILLIVLALLALSACGNKIESTARSFFDAMEKQDIAKMKDYVTEEGQQILTMAEAFTAEMSEEQKDGMEKMKYKILETTEDGDNAVVSFEQWEVDNPEDKETNELKLTKIDGEWKVDLSKEDMDK